MTYFDGTIRKVLKPLLKYKLSPEGTIVTGELRNERVITVILLKHA